MINEQKTLRYCCENINNIENASIAINDKFQIWEIHHRLETDKNISRQQLINDGLYYKRPASELIFLTKADHTAIHNRNRKLSEETKHKIAQSHKGKPSWNKGKPMPEETKLKLSKALKGHTSWNKGKPISEETKRKISEAHIGKKCGPHSSTTIEKMKEWRWYTDGKINVRAKECPEGFIRGRTIIRT